MTYVEFQAALLTYLLAQPTLTALVGDSLYFVNYASLADLVYPAITFQSAEGHDFLGIMNDFPAIAYVHSEKTYDEAHQIADLLSGQNGLLDGLLLSTKAVIRVIGNPTENYIEAPRLYNVAIPLHVWLL